ncbi:MAG: hypothetical protein ACHQPH_27390, partial [Reyranellales bacterium]
GMTVHLSRANSTSVVRFTVPAGADVPTPRSAVSALSEQRSARPGDSRLECPHITDMRIHPRNRLLNGRVIATAARWLSRRTRLVCIASLLALAASAAEAAPKTPQCWDCIERLAMELPDTNALADPAYEEELSPASVLPALLQCSLDDGEIPTLQQIIRIFTDAQAEGDGVAYVREHLEQIPKLSVDDRAKLTDGARQDLNTTRRHLIDHNCRLLLKSHFDEGASRQWIIQMIALGRKSGAQ